MSRDYSEIPKQFYTFIVLYNTQYNSRINERLFQLIADTMSIFYFCPDLTPSTATKLKENKSKVTQAIVIVWVWDSMKCTVLMDVIQSVSRGFFFAWGPRNNVSDIKCPLYSCPKYCRLSPFPAQVKNIFFPKYFYTRPEIIDCMMSCSRDTIPSSFP